MDLQVNDIAELKKEHPCGSKRWQVLRVGMDISCGVWAAGMRSCSHGGRWKK